MTIPAKATRATGLFQTKITLATNVPIKVISHNLKGNGIAARAAGVKFL